MAPSCALTPFPGRLSILQLHEPWPQAWEPPYLLTRRCSDRSYQASVHDQQKCCASQPCAVTLLFPMTFISMLCSFHQLRHSSRPSRRGKSGHASFPRTTMSSEPKSKETDALPTLSNSKHPEHPEDTLAMNYVLHGIPSRQ
ncbi:hypothetical protein ARMGADRAFT_778926 [Armillaria gallica]|uniref:Uncharacterized protein n=1 Tax=Armillaria gallica TaxID=47427 RepID=A0A2H3CEK0_ARMGA|nr:hypothetical protein ARMGADRAFT_778926 [Armillaria gallica]